MIRTVLTACWFTALACGGSVREPVDFELRYAGANASESFVTDTGFTVTLEQLHVALGPVRMFEADQHGGHDEHDVEEEVIATLTWFLLRTAHAHPGDGETPEGLVAEQIDQVVVDVLSEGSSQPVPVRGYAAEIDDIDAIISGPSETAKGDVVPLGGHPVRVTGVARRETVEVPFSGVLMLAEVESTDVEIHVDAEPFSPTFETRMTITIDPAPWFAAAEFDTLTDVDADGRYVVGNDTQVGSQWRHALAAEGVLEAIVE